ncbi:hypothetical protein TanjilG_10533 [Lupinus angustifolius]|uniref:Uncharacterized protein n=2 Tax=Lupinus angustifolius TaxID=3871 RepID=A0A1J7FW47_LUPAN|nr:hypothetical protein TanjilG_10533 [Lupinus angustifolius]
MNMHSNNLVDLPSMLSSLSKLRSVWVQSSSEFQLTQDFRRILDGLSDVNVTELETSKISKHSLRSFLIGMGSCSQVFNTLSSSISQELTANVSSDFSLLGDNYPSWLTYTGEGNSVLFEVPQVNDYCLQGMVLCVAYSSTPENIADECLTGVLIVNNTNSFIQLYKRDTVMSLNDDEWQGIVSSLAPHDKVEIFVSFEHRLTVKKTTLYLIYGDSIDGEMEPSSGSMIPDKMLLDPDLTKPNLTEPMKLVTMLSNLDQKETRKNSWFWCNCFAPKK